MQRINGSGVPLPAPQNLYPSELYNAAPDFGNNEIALQPGQGIPLPPGDYMVTVGSYSILQILDPIGNYWRHASAPRGQPFWLFNDGYTRRIVNLTGCPIAAVVAGGGTSFAQATCTVTANVGGSTWQPIVGGSLGVNSITAPGSFNLPPLVLIPDPPVYAANSIGGVPAYGTSTLTNGTVSHVSLTDVGAGYTAATITGYLLPNPYDPSVGTATPGTVNFTLTNAGIITAVLPTNNGGSLGTPTTITLTAAGGSGSGATITPVVMQTVVSAATTSVGAGWGNVANPAKITTTGGQPASVSAIGNSSVELTGFKPRDANITGTTNAAGCITALTLIDGGLFVGTPGVAIIPGGTVPTTAATIALTMGGVNDGIYVQPL
jgi:hypothetical protein